MPDVNDEVNAAVGNLLEVGCSVVEIKSPGVQKIHNEAEDCAEDEGEGTDSQKGAFRHG